MEHVVNTHQCIRQASTMRSCKVWRGAKVRSVHVMWCESVQSFKVSTCTPNHFHSLIRFPFCSSHASNRCLSSTAGLDGIRASLFVCSLADPCNTCTCDRSTLGETPIPKPTPMPIPNTKCQMPNAKCQPGCFRCHPNQNRCFFFVPPAIKSIISFSLPELYILNMF